MPYDQVHLLERAAKDGSPALVLRAHLEPGPSGPGLDSFDPADPYDSLQLITPVAIPSEVSKLKQWEVAVVGSAAASIGHRILLNTHKSLTIEGYEQPIWRIQPEYMSPLAVGRLARFYGWDLELAQVLECIARSLHGAGIAPGPVVRYKDAAVRYQFVSRNEGVRLCLLNVSEVGVRETNASSVEIACLFQAFESRQPFRVHNTHGTCAHRGRRQWPAASGAAHQSP